MPNYPAPDRVLFPVMLQSWCDLTFLHWRYPVEAVQRLLPSPLSVDSFDGSAWVGLTPFVVRNLRPPLVPPLPWISTFPETNCRTYVTAPDGGSGVWFFSLDAARALAVAGARLAYWLPYAWSRMRVVKTGRRISYQSARRWPDRTVTTSIRIEEGSDIAPGELEVFLTARYRLYSFIAGHLVKASVEHAPWPLKSAELLGVEENLTWAAGLSRPAGLPLVHFSRGVRVRVGRPTSV